MRTFNHFYENPESFKNYIEEIEIDKGRRLLVRIHSTLHSVEEIQPIAQAVQDELPSAVIIGCSTTIVICEGKLCDEGCLVSITEMEDCELRLGMFSCLNEDGTEKDGETLCREVSDNLVKGDSGMMLVFLPLSYYKIAKFVNKMNLENKDLIMAGGVSYTAKEHHQDAENSAYVLGGTIASPTHMAAVMIVSPSLHIYETVLNGVERIGRNYEVTKVHEQYIDEIENQAAGDWYEEMLGKEQLAQDPTLTGIFPLIAEGSKQTLNTVYEPYETLPEPWKSEKKSRVTLFSEIPNGMRFSLGYFDPGKIVEELSQVYQTLKTKPVETVFVYSCLARMWTLNNCAAWEIGQFETTDISGALLAGEIGNADGQNLYANATFVIAGISENANSRLLLKEKELQNVSALQYDNAQMINYLLTMGNKQLNRQLDEQRSKMQRAMFFNEQLGLDNQTKYLFDRETVLLDKIAVFSLNNERILKLFLGRTALQQELKQIYQHVREQLSDARYRLYSYSENSLLVAAGDDLDDDQFRLSMSRLFESLSATNRMDISFVYRCALVLHEEKPLQQVEATLQYGETKKIPFVIYNDMPGSSFNVKKDMHILKVVREALQHDRIVPFFQGIYDNREKRINMYEALIRIQDEQGNLYYPDQFLPLSKEYGLYNVLSVMMVDKVMNMFLNKNIRITINLNVQDIYDRSMIKKIFHNLEQEQHPENFVFELVESEEVQDYEYIKQFADRIHEYGAQIAIDDFGSGFSNIIHIMRIDADIIKIDGEIIREICTDESCREFLEMIHSWCRRRDKSVIAEYVENEDIQHIMEEIGISHSQGYYFAKPKRWEEADAH